MLRGHLFLFPYAAPSTVIFVGNSPIGVRQGCRTLPKGQESLRATPDKNDGAQEASGIGSPKLWILSFVEKCSCIFHIHHVHVAWRSKRKYLAFGCENPIKMNVAVATHSFYQLVHLGQCVTSAIQYQFITAAIQLKILVSPRESTCPMYDAAQTGFCFVRII
jgi:hypothetical protein